MAFVSLWIQDVCQKCQSHRTTGWNCMRRINDCVTIITGNKTNVTGSHFRRQTDFKSTQKNYRQWKRRQNRRRRTTTRTWNCTNLARNNTKVKLHTVL